MQIFINHNGNFISADAPVVAVNNRSFRYGDALFETIRITNYNPQFLKEHLQRLFNGMKVLKMEMNPLFNDIYIEHAILELAQKNGVTSDGRARLTVYRNEGGLYAPSDNNVSFILEVSPIEEKGYVLNTKGYTVDLYTEFK
ncbi:MAG: aminotransferase class IV, partial [Bacteroidia bacterium]